MAKIYSIDVQVWATAYIRADTPEEAMEIARGLKDDELTVDGAFDSGVVTGEGFSRDMFDISLSPVMTIAGPSGDSEPDEVHDDDDDDEETANAAPAPPGELGTLAVDGDELTRIYGPLPGDDHE
jgi:hypothetical protein